MKKTLLFITICCFSISCNNNQEESRVVKPLDENSSSKYFSNFSKSTRIEYKGMEVEFPDGYPKDLLTFKTKDFEDIALNKSQKNILKVKNIKGNSLKEIIDDVYTKYPTFDYFDAKEYQKIFPKLSIQEINEKSEAILEYVEKIMAFDIASAFSQLSGAAYSLDPNSRKSRGPISSGDWLNSACTVSVVISHPRLDISGLYLAVDKANAMSATYGLPTTNGGSNDYMDAVRHGVWGVFLGKEGTWRYSDPDNAVDIITQLLNAHECGQSGLGTAMDGHNNVVALMYYKTHVQITGSWPNRNTRIHETFENVASTIAAYPCDYVTNVADINSRNLTTLVRIQ